MCCLFVIAQPIKPKTENINSAVPPTPKNPAAIFGKPLIIPLCITKNMIAVINTLIPKDFHSTLYFLKYIIKVINGIVSRFNKCSPVARPII